MELLVLLSILLAHMIPEPRGRSCASEHSGSQLVPWWHFSSESELIDTPEGETSESRPPKPYSHPSRAARESAVVGRARLTSYWPLTLPPRRRPGLQAICTGSRDAMMIATVSSPATATNTKASEPSELCERQRSPLPPGFRWSPRWGGRARPLAAR